MQIPERSKLEEAYRSRAGKYDAAARRQLRRLQRLVASAGINASIKYRVKSFDSYFEKILRQGKDGGAKAALTDVIGFRIVCPFLSDLETVRELIGERFRVLETERKGSEHSFREFGYASVHLLIDLAGEIKQRPLPATRHVAEIQLRTILQDAWAEVEHELVYKTDDTLFHEQIKRKLASLNATLTLSDIIFQEIREYQREVQQRESRRKASIEARLLPYDAFAGEEEMELAFAAARRDDKPVGLHHKSEVDGTVFEALTAHSNDEFVKAIELYSRALRLKTNRQVRSVVYNHRGMAYLALSQHAPAMRDFNNAVKFNDQNFRALNNRALAHRIRQEYDRALDDLERSLAINAVQAEAYYIRGLTHLDLQDYSKALHDCERVLNIKPDFAVAQHLKALVLSKAGK